MHVCDYGCACCRPFGYNSRGIRLRWVFLILTCEYVDLRARERETETQRQRHTHFSEMSTSKSLFELTEHCVATPTHTATVPDILLQKVVMFSLSQLGIVLMHQKLWSFILLCQLQGSLSQLICFPSFILANKIYCY